MKDLIDAMISSDYLGIYIAIGVLILLMIVISLIDRYLRRSKEEEVEEIEEIDEVGSMDTDIIIEDKSAEISEIEAMLDQELSVSNTIEPTEEVKPMEDVEEIKYVDDAMEKTNAQLELQRLTEELKKAEEVTKNIDLTDFELEQEETAIISLDELLEKGDTLYDKNEITQYEDEGNEPINLKELEERYKIQQEEKQTVVLDDFNTARKKPETAYVEEKKFKSSPVISPIYGIEEKNVNKDQALELENTANYDKLDEEIRKTNEFLQILKELQKKLD